MSIFRPKFAKRILDRSAKRRVVDSYLRQPRTAATAWIRSSARPDNFYYGLTPRNSQHLVELLAVTFGYHREHVATVAGELHESSAVAEAGARLGVPPRSLYGRRLGWYVIARLTRPSFTVETGVHDGIGAVLLVEALRRNALEGYPGIYRGTDIDPTAGWLLQSVDVDAEVLLGDSIKSLQTMAPASVDLFINDSDHSADYEYREYQTMTSRLSDRGVILGDNAHATDSLLTYSRENGRDFIFFDERPLDHWYPGAGIGISLKREVVA